MTKIIMHGCNGKMGQVISQVAANDSETEIVAGIDLNTNTALSYPVFDSLENCTVDADVIIDFSIAVAVDSLLDYVEATKVPLILCTTGLSKEQMDRVYQISQTAPVFFSANMSIGVNLLIGLAKQAAKVLTGSNFDIEIIEKHHNQKVDAPSGTALAIAHSINETLDFSYEYKFDRSGEREKRHKNEIGIHAMRGGTIVGEHSILFAGQDEIIELKHNALSKEVFAVGAVRAAKFMHGRKEGLYDMSHLIQETN
ncbi:4-hydroxy-tetrahydrodipicolinate reductase [Vallitalea okinawensis]|uniref:4-hydroxy-tetrahydrodipicolinate reductase n=1 Tax=Vallitalea okinawensis TaxID=2078660 RepID=UPI000CFAD682|nr:4-hydroxy-tetrahydrodipicolinate reductase [Vallitalea okinawensis]